MQQHVAKQKNIQNNNHTRGKGALDNGQNQNYKNVVSVSQQQPKQQFREDGSSSIVIEFVPARVVRPGSGLTKNTIL